MSISRSDRFSAEAQSLLRQAKARSFSTRRTERDPRHGAAALRVDPLGVLDQLNSDLRTLDENAYFGDRRVFDRVKHMSTSLYADLTAARFLAFQSARVGVVALELASVLDATVRLSHGPWAPDALKEFGTRVEEELAPAALADLHSYNPAFVEDQYLDVNAVDILNIWLQEQLQSATGEPVTPQLVVYGEVNPPRYVQQHIDEKLAHFSVRAAGHPGFHGAVMREALQTALTTSARLIEQSPDPSTLPLQVLTFTSAVRDGFSRQLTIPPVGGSSFRF